MLIESVTVHTYYSLYNSKKFGRSKSRPYFSALRPGDLPVAIKGHRLLLVPRSINSLW